VKLRRHTGKKRCRAFSFVNLCFVVGSFFLICFLSSSSFMPCKASVVHSTHPHPKIPPPPTTSPSLLPLPLPLPQSKSRYQPLSLHLHTKPTGTTLLLLLEKLAQFLRQPYRATIASFSSLHPPALYSTSPSSLPPSHPPPLLPSHHFLTSLSSSRPWTRPPSYTRQRSH
jgi:hypothetical protein